MKRGLLLFAVMVMLTGCIRSDEGLHRAMLLREKLLSSSCTFETVVTADYGDNIYSFSLKCRSDQEGNLSFEVISPESISGITGMVSSSGGKLTFDDTALTFMLLADGEVSPVSAPWILIRTLQGGYLSAWSQDGENLRLTVDDSYEEDSLQLEIWLDAADTPQSAEILWQGRRILSLSVSNFTFV